MIYIYISKSYMVHLLYANKHIINGPYMTLKNDKIVFESHIYMGQLLLNIEEINRTDVCLK